MKRRGFFYTLTCAIAGAALNLKCRDLPKIIHVQPQIESVTRQIFYQYPMSSFPLIGLLNTKEDK